MISRIVLAACLVAAPLSGCGAVTRTEQPTTPGEDNTALGAGDIFDVRVYNEPDLSMTYQVAPDGTVDYPFIGRVAVVGLEPTEIADLLATRLNEGGFLRRPQISVLVKEYNSKRISVVGSVARPGALTMTSGLTVVQAISLSGGFTPLASRNNVVVTRRVQGALRRFHIPVGDVMQGHADDFILNAGDIIYVPESIL